MKISLSSRVEFILPKTPNPSLQNLYFFNLYRSGSSVVEAAALSLAALTGRTPFNLSQVLYDRGVEYADIRPTEELSIYLTKSEELAQFCNFGGYVFYGFREIPIGFAHSFSHHGASSLIVRDPRDIGISHYYAVSKHVVDNPVLEKHITASRQLVEAMKLEDYLLSQDVISFLRRICRNYAPLIHKGVTPHHYEDLHKDGSFSLERLCATLLAGFGKYAGVAIDLKTFTKMTEEAVRNSGTLKGHATSGGTEKYRGLDPEVQKELTVKLSDCLELLGYDPG